MKGEGRGDIIHDSKVGRGGRGWSGERDRQLCGRARLKRKRERERQRKKKKKKEMSNDEK